MADAVLVVEDDPSTRELLTQALDLEGFAPSSAANGWDALRYLQAGGAASVILLDLIMPVMDGWMFRREQRADPRLADIPVVVVTASDLYRIQELDADVVLRKPVNVDELVRIVRDVCRQRRHQT